MKTEEASKESVEALCYRRSPCVNWCRSFVLLVLHVGLYTLDVVTDWVFYASVVGDHRGADLGVEEVALLVFCVVGSALYVMSIFVVRGVNAANAWYESPTFFVAVEAGRRCGRIEDHEAFALDLLLQENSVFATVLQDVPQIVISAVIASKTEFTTVQVVALVVSCLGIAYRAVQCARSAAGRGANGWHTGFLVSMCLMPKELAAARDTLVLCSIRNS